MKEIRRIESACVRVLCIKEQFYTRGNSEAYDNLLNNLCSDDVNVTVIELENIADDILAHSNTDKIMREFGCGYEAIKTNLMHNLVSDCCTSIFK